MAVREPAAAREPAVVRVPAAVMEPEVVRVLEVVRVREVARVLEVARVPLAPAGLDLEGVRRVEVGPVQVRAGAGPGQGAG